MFTTGETEGPAERIIDDTCLVVVVFGWYRQQQQQQQASKVNFWGNKSVAENNKETKNFLGYSALPTYVDVDD